MSVYCHNTVSHFQSLLLGGPIIGKAAHHRQCAMVIQRKKAQNDQETGQKVHKHPGQQNNDPLPPGAVWKSPGVSRLSFSISFHCAKAANRQPTQGIIRFFTLFMDQKRPHADGKLVDLHPTGFGRHKVTKLMQSDQDTKHQNSNENVEKQGNTSRENNADHKRSAKLPQPFFQTGLTPPLPGRPHRQPVYHPETGPGPQAPAP